MSGGCADLDLSEVATSGDYLIDRLLQTGPRMPKQAIIQTIPSMLEERAFDWPRLRVLEY